MLVMSLLLVSLLLQGMGWLLLAMEDPRIGRIAEDRLLASVATTKPMWWLRELSGTSPSSSAMYSMPSSSKPPWLLWDCAIAGSVPGECILCQTMLRILYIVFSQTSGYGEQKSMCRQRNMSLHELLTVWLLFLVSQLRHAPPHGQNSGGTLFWPVFQSDRQWLMVVVVRAMKV